MSRIFHHYATWEDHQHGAYALSCEEPDQKRTASRELLGEAERFRSVCWEVLEAWPYAAEVNMTNKESNRRAWLGQAACCFDHEAPEFIVRQAWAALTPEQRTAANRMADQVIAQWEVDRAETLFGP